ncbi:SLAC1 family transporter [Actinoallomurus rhizosphaericola]|uniref:SLAC1 family transporter n=1 Tax=Actinoallomurus rhizosphaericola TaxID=2952536 RepID=UPI002090D231|nr:hypothetical protein [Actinoallomurus rhizosphaericola]MCO5994311.1 hypothetical protein [Actinoallomurus rhizosphaericola]
MAADEAEKPETPAVRRVPLNLFGMAFGIAGLAGTWLTVARYGHAPLWAGRTLLAVSAIVWAVTVARYARYALSVRGAFAADLTDPVAAPFAALAMITPMPAASQGLYAYDSTAGTVVFDVFLVLTVLLGGWMTGQWIYGSLSLDQLHPGYFLPTVAGGLVAAAGAAAVGQRTLGYAMLGLGLICWFILGSMIMARLFFRPALPPALYPTLAIEVAPAAVATVAYVSLHGPHVDAFSAILAGYGTLMVLAQLRLLPAFTRLRFAPSFWAFTFSWAAVATSVVHWTQILRPTGYLVYTYAALAAVTLLIAGIAVRTVLATFSRGGVRTGPPRISPATAEEH